MRSGAEAHGGELLGRAVEGVGVARELQRRGHVLERGHGGDEVEGLEHHPHMLAAEAGQRVLVHGPEVAAQRPDLAPGGALEPPPSA